MELQLKAIRANADYSLEQLAEKTRMWKIHCLEMGAPALTHAPKDV